VRYKILPVGLSPEYHLQIEVMRKRVFLAIRNDSSGRLYVLLQMFCLFTSLNDLRTPSADRRETLPHDRYLGALYKPNVSPKIRGARPEKFGAKTQFMSNFGRFYATADELIVNIAGKSQDIQNRKDMCRELFLPRSAKEVR